MATPMTAPNTDDIIPIEIDEPGSAPHASADEATEPPLELDMEPIEPEWLRSARRRIALTGSRQALNFVVRDLQTLTEAQKVQLRPFVTAQWAKIDAAANKHACEVAQALGKHKADCAYCVSQRPAAIPMTAAPDAEDIAAHTVAPTQEPTPVEIAAPAQEPAQEPVGALESMLDAIAGEGATNAAVADLGAQSANAESSNAGRRLGVGFSSPAQYLEALQRGGLQPHTRAVYLQTVRAAGLALDEGALPPANTATLPVGPGVTHTPTEPSIFDRPKAERGLKVGAAVQQVRSGAALLRAGDLIAGSIAGGAGGDFSWAGKGKITRAALLAALAEIGREAAAPAAKNAHAQAGRAVTSLRSLGYHVHAVQGEERKGLPAHVAHRYIVGRPEVGDSQTTAIGAEYGRRVLVVDLHQDDTLHCEGQSDAAARVKADFEARCAADIYVSADLTSWLQRTLRDAHGATRFGIGWYVPAGQREAGERLTRAVAEIWGESWRHGMPVAACSHLFEGLTEGLSDEIRKIEEEWSGAKEKAAEAHKLSVGTRAAAGLLGKVAEVSERVRGYAVLLGDDTVAPLRVRLAKLDGEIRPLTDDTSARASMLEFS